MRLYQDVKSTRRPLNIDEVSSETAVYVNTNIRRDTICIGHVEKEDGTFEEKTQTLYIYDSLKYTRQEWINYQITLLRGNSIDPTVDANSSLDEIKKSVCKLMENERDRMIESGIDVQTNKGIEHFSLPFRVQYDIDTITNKVVVLDMKEVIFQSDEGYSRLYDNQEFMRVSMAAKDFILRQTTYCNFLINYIKSLTEDDKETILDFSYGDPLPDDLTKQYTDMVNAEIAEFRGIIDKVLNIQV